MASSHNKHKKQQSLNSIRTRLNLIMVMAFIFIIILAALFFIVYDNPDLSQEGDSTDMRMTACFTADSRGECNNINSDLVTKTQCCEEFNRCCD